MEYYRSRKKQRQRMWVLLRLLVLAVLVGTVGVFVWQNSQNKNGLSHPKVQDGRSKEKAQADFDALMLEIFRDEVTSDSVTLNYTLKNPEKYNIQDMEPTLGHYSMEEMQSHMAVSENQLAAIESYDYDKLREDQQLTYDIVHTVLKQNLEASGMQEYSEPLSPTTGLQTQLPVILVEYHFWDKSDVEIYLKLLGLLPEYFQEILTFEEQKSQDGLFMGERTAKAIINQCKQFIEKPEKNLMITTFSPRLDSLKLSDSEKQKYISANKDAVLNSVIPAYQTLIDGMEKLQSTGKNQNGLCGLEQGKEYYQYLVRSKTGTNRSIKDIRKLLDETIDENKKRMSKILVKNDRAYEQALNATYPSKAPEETLSYLQKECVKDFPELPEGIKCEMKYVDSSLEESISPAFYLTAAIDDYKNNVVYLNGSKEYDLSKAFTTIAHESYPGHLYQSCYFQSLEQAPIRSVIDIGGYSEGWGTYAELYSYSLAGLEDDVAELLRVNTLLTLAIYGKVDLEVNYNGWDYKKTQTYLNDFGFGKTTGRVIFDAVVAEPAGYMQYTLGYLEIEDLRGQAQKALGEKYSLKGFHEFFLSTGEAPFIVLQDRLEQWIAAEKGIETIDHSKEKG
ncbi:MAG: DUF885 domain-containing protein [Lachnospiraceae bacterium]|nr:DUF885 domain-containing protein [Lachnospiraceae bacterium]